VLQGRHSWQQNEQGRSCGARKGCRGPHGALSSCTLAVSWHLSRLSGTGRRAIGMRLCARKPIFCELCTLDVLGLAAGVRALSLLIRIFGGKRLQAREHVVHAACGSREPPGGDRALLHTPARRQRDVGAAVYKSGNRAYIAVHHRLSVLIFPGFVLLRCPSLSNTVCPAGCHDRRSASGSKLPFWRLLWRVHGRPPASTASLHVRIFHVSFAHIYCCPTAV
jgi:hypothetical protein